MKNIIEQIQKSKRILITSHINPDGDSIGSTLALLLALNNNNEENKVIRLVLQDEVPSFLKYIKHSFLIEKRNMIETKYKFDLLIALDSADLQRIGNIKDFISDETTLINIDHHISNMKFGDFNYVDAEASSASEIVYRLIKEMGFEISLDIAEALYTGIASDTGNFAYSNTSSETLLIASKLKEVGIDNEKISQYLYSNKSEKQLRILGLALENMKFYEDVKLNLFYLRQTDLKRFDAKKEDTEGVVEMLRSYKECEVALFLREEADGTIKGSFRSKGRDVNEVAQLFDGGGHKKAAGFQSDKTEKEIIEMILKKLNR